MSLAVVFGLAAAGVLVQRLASSAPRRSRARATGLRHAPGVSVVAPAFAARSASLGSALERLTAFVRRVWELPHQQRAVERGLGDALEAMAAALRSGRSLADGVALAAGQAPGALGSDLVAVAARMQRGAPLDTALAAWADERSVPAVALAVAGLRLAADVGGAQGGVLDDLAATVRERVAADDELRAAATQARASAAVLAVAPVGFALFSGLVDPHTLRETVGQPVGLVCLVLGLALDVAGGVWMLRLSGRRA